MLTIIAFIVVIGVLVFVHELGHFLAAKAAGIYVHRFSLGLGTPIPWLTFQRGETEYTVAWLPLGGYVKMASREEEGMAGALEGGKVEGVEVPPDRVYEAKPLWVRMIVILAGVVMNVVFAFLIFTGLTFASGLTVLKITEVGGVVKDSLPPGAAALGSVLPGDRIVAVDGAPVGNWDEIQRRWRQAPGDTVRVVLQNQGELKLALAFGSAERDRALIAVRPLIVPVIGLVQQGKPGAKAGLQVGDTILSVDQIPVRQWTDLVDKIESKPDQEIVLELARGGQRLTLHATPAPEKGTDTARKVGKLGIGPELPEQRIPVGFLASVREGGRQTLFVSTQVFQIVRGMVSGKVSTREIGGPIAIGMAAGESARRGPGDFLFFMGAISVNLAVLNLLPIPILDGGQFLFLVGEGVLRRPLSPRLKERLSMLGLLILLSIMVLAFWNDIRRLLTAFGI